jgi:hypothetical protein
MSEATVYGVPLFEAFVPFDHIETRRLRRFVKRVEQLRESSFFDTPGHRIMATFTGGRISNVRAQSAGDEAVRAVIGPFRELYSDSEPTSAMATLKLLEGHARAADRNRNQELIGQLRALRTRIKERRQRDPRGVLLEEQPDGGSAAVTPHESIVTWLYGEHLHYDLAKADRLEEHQAMTEMLLFILESAIRDFAHLWGRIVALTAAILDTPELTSSP